MACDLGRGWHHTVRSPPYRPALMLASGKQKGVAIDSSPGFCSLGVVTSGVGPSALQAFTMLTCRLTPQVTADTTGSPSPKVCGMLSCWSGCPITAWGIDLFVCHPQTSAQSVDFETESWHGILRRLLQVHSHSRFRGRVWAMIIEDTMASQPTPSNHSPCTRCFCWPWWWCTDAPVGYLHGCRD